MGSIDPIMVLDPKFNKLATIGSNTYSRSLSFTERDFFFTITAFLQFSKVHSVLSLKKTR